MCASYRDEIPGSDKLDFSHEVLPRQQTLHIDMEPLPQDHQPLLTRIQTEGQNENVSKTAEQRDQKDIVILQPSALPTRPPDLINRDKRSMWNLVVLPIRRTKVKPGHS